MSATPQGLTLCEYKTHHWNEVSAVSTLTFQILKQKRKRMDRERGVYNAS